MYCNDGHKQDLLQQEGETGGVPHGVVFVACTESGLCSNHMCYHHDHESRRNVGQHTRLADADTVSHDDQGALHYTSWLTNISRP